MQRGTKTTQLNTQKSRLPSELLHIDFSEKAVTNMCRFVLKTTLSNGLDYMQQRWYSSFMGGRFISHDPAAPDYLNPLTLNRYTYALNDPVNRIDPDGRFAISATVLATMGAGALIGWGTDYYMQFRQSRYSQQGFKTGLGNYWNSGDYSNFRGAVNAGVGAATFGYYNYMIPAKLATSTLANLSLKASISYATGSSLTNFENFLLMKTTVPLGEALVCLPVM